MMMDNNEWMMMMNGWWMNEWIIMEWIMNNEWMESNDWMNEWMEWLNNE